MALRTRIAVTFLLLLAAVLAAALSAVLATNRDSAGREVKRQLDVGAMVFSRLLESNRKQLTQAAQAVAADYGFREAVAAHDTGTLASALENSGERIGAAMVVLTSLDGEVIAASGTHLAAGAPFPIAAFQDTAGAKDSATTMMMDGGRLYQFVTVPVRSPLPVAWIAMGFELDNKAARELADITGLYVTLSLNSAGHWSNVVSTLPEGALRRGHGHAANGVVQGGRHRGRRDLIALACGGTRSVRALDEGLVRDRGRELGRLRPGRFLAGAQHYPALQDLTRCRQDARRRYDAAQIVQRRDELGVLERTALDADGGSILDQSIRRLAYEDAPDRGHESHGVRRRVERCLKDAEDRLSASLSSICIAFAASMNISGIRSATVLTKIAARIAGGAVRQLFGGAACRRSVCGITASATAAGLHAWGTSLLVALADPIYVEAQPIDISPTLGLAMATDNNVFPDELIRCADLALESARREKRALAIYEEALKPAARDQLSLLGELGHAVEHDEMRLYFQPKIELATNRVAGAEVLLRWQHPKRGLLSPADFIPFAEQTGFIRRLTRWTLDHAIAQGAEWQRAGRPLSLAVNISAEDIADVRLDSRVASLLSRHQFPPALLTLEVTESGFIEDPTRALRVLDAVAALGVSLSIDDFGTGYSSLSHLPACRCNEVKIDRSFIQGLESDPEFATVVRSAIDMGHGLGLKVVAEGIETEASANLLREFRCDNAQGYLYAKPMTWRSPSRHGSRARIACRWIAVPVALSKSTMLPTR